MTSIYDHAAGTTWPVTDRLGLDFLAGLSWHVPSRCGLVVHGRHVESRRLRTTFGMSRSGRRGATGRVRSLLGM